jgi:tetratricopeptide (TPR) repeat protein/CHAT domain-containing protein
VNAALLDHSNQVGLLNNLGAMLRLRFKRTGAMDDLNRAVEIVDQAVRATPLDHPDRAGQLSSLGNLLGRRFERTGAMDDLNRAVEVADQAVSATPLDHPNRAGQLSNLGNLLGKRFERTGAMGDLNRAVEIANQVVDTTPLDHPDRAGWLSNLGRWLSRRFEWTGAMDDLNRAVEVANQVVNTTPLDHPDRAGQLSNLGNRLAKRFERTGAMDDLNRAVEVANQAMNATPLDHPNRAGQLSNLGNLLGRRFERTEAMDDLNRAVEVTDQAVSTTPLDHPSRAGRLSNLANRLGKRFRRTEAMDDLNRAVEIADQAVSAIPLDHPDRARQLSNLGWWLGRRFERTGAMDDLNRAVEVANQAVNATPFDHPERAGRLSNLGNLLGKRFERTGAMEDFHRSTHSYTDGWNCEGAPPSIRIGLARRAARLLALQSMWEESSNFLQGAVKLLPIVSPRLLENADKQHVLGEFAGLTSMAVATALEARKDSHYALELLELGRCVIAGLLLEMRTDISALKEQHPRLAEDFESLRDQLDSPSRETAPLGSSSDTASQKLQATRRHEADKKFNQLIAEIRALPGFSNFLSPPNTDELMAAADQGPIVIVNISPCRCDAFLIERHQIRLLELPDLRQGELKKKAKQGSVGLASTLQWLWDVAVGPILDELGFKQPPSDNNWPHVWWIPTGALSHFPLHAAGYHTKGSINTVIDRVMSSYSSSVKALIYRRRHSVWRQVGPMSDHALLVAMRDTPGLAGNSVLSFATKEVEMLTDLCPSLQLRPSRPPQRREDVLSHLRTCKVFHFAGHGRSDLLDPSRSCLLLEDWEDNPLTVGDLRDHKVQESSPFLGYLSACSTSANKVDRFVDEGIHLTSALQIAGFRHVIGTLWEVSDSYCVDVAETVYKTIVDEGMTDVAVCRGLHRAIRALRDRSIEVKGMTGESSAAGRTTTIPEVEVVIADSGSVEAIQGVVDDKVKEDMHKSAPSAPTAQESQSTSRKGIEDMNGGDKEDGMGRDAKLCGFESWETGLVDPLYWAPYIHFGV